MENSPNAGGAPDQPPTYPREGRRSVDLLDKKDLSPATVLEVDNSNFLTIELNQDDDYTPAYPPKANRPPESPAVIANKLSHSNSFTSSVTTTVSKNLYYTCSHCSYRFMFNDLVNKMVKCPSCKQNSCISDDYKNTNGIVFLLLFIAFLILGISSGFRHGTINVIYKVLTILASFLFLYRSIYFFTLKVSPMNLNGA